MIKVRKEVNGVMPGDVSPVVMFRLCLDAKMVRTNCVHKKSILQILHKLNKGDVMGFINDVSHSIA